MNNTNFADVVFFVVRGVVAGVVDGVVSFVLFIVVDMVVVVVVEVLVEVERVVVVLHSLLLCAAASTNVKCLHVSAI